MQARNPGYVSINNRRAKVHKWQPSPTRIEVGMLVHGHQSGMDLIEQIREDSVSIAWDEAEAITVRPELTHHRLVGDGPTSVHRIEATFWLPETEPAKKTVEERLNRVETELKQLRAEIAELMHSRSTTSSSQPMAMRQHLDSGKTLLDTEMDTDDSNDE